MLLAHLLFELLRVERLGFAALFAFDQGRAYSFDLGFIGLVPMDAFWIWVLHAI